MHCKLLKETSRSLTLLKIEDANKTESLFTELFCERALKSFKDAVSASGCKEALELYSKDQHDVIFVEVSASFKEGLDAIIKIKELNEQQSIIAFSSDEYNDSQLLLELLNLGVSGFINKDTEKHYKCPMLAKVCNQIFDTQILFHYLDSCEIENIGNTIKEKNSIEDDDFDFFPSPENDDGEKKENSDFYRDYFNSLQHEDREELKDLIVDIDSALLSAFDEEAVNKEYLLKLSNSVMRYGNILMYYQFFEDMGIAILELGKIMYDEPDHIEENAKIFGMGMTGFCSVLNRFIREVWENECENPKFYNDSIINDAKSILQSVKTPEKKSADADVMFF